MFSNTATPKYYGEFRDKVIAGDIPVNEQISLEMNRIDKLIEDPDVWYDDGPIEGFIEFCEGEMCLTDGSDLHMLPMFKVWAEQIFGWYVFKDLTVYEPGPNNHGGRFVRKRIKRRLTQKQFLIVARGAAKSMYATLLHSYFLNVDPTTTKQITVAPTMKQAEEVMSAFSTAIVRARGPLFQFLTEGSLQNTTGSRALRQKLVTTKKGIQNFLTNSILEIRPMSIDKLQGLQVKVSTVDEWLSGDTREDVIGPIEQGATKIPEYLVVAISSEGTVRNGPGDTVKMELASILKGDYSAPHVSIWHYKLDDLSEVGEPAKWPKANPNLGFTVGYDVYALEVERMENAPATRNDILAKRFGIPMEGLSYFFTYEETLCHRPQNYRGMACSLGVDLSQGDDFCAFTFVFPLRDGAFGIKTRSYISSHTMMSLPSAMRVKYQEFIDEGSLHVLEGTVLDMNEVYDDLYEFKERERYEVLCMGYDPYNAKDFLQRWIVDHGEYGIEKVQQGVRTESVPLGELKKMASERLLIFDEELMKWSMGNCIVMEDTNGNRKLYKRRYSEKIDNPAAMMDGWVAYKIFKDSFG